MNKTQHYHNYTIAFIFISMNAQGTLHILLQNKTRLNVDLVLQMFALSALFRCKLKHLCINWSVLQYLDFLWIFKSITRRISNRFLRTASHLCYTELSNIRYLWAGIPAQDVGTTYHIYSAFSWWGLRNISHVPIQISFGLRSSESWPLWCYTRWSV